MNLNAKIASSVLSQLVLAQTPSETVVVPYKSLVIVLLEMQTQEEKTLPRQQQYFRDALKIADAVVERAMNNLSDETDVDCQAYMSLRGKDAR